MNDSREGVVVLETSAAKYLTGDRGIFRIDDQTNFYTVKCAASLQDSSPVYGPFIKNCSESF